MNYDILFNFEKALAKFTGAPYALVTDCCTHAIELAMLHDNVTWCRFTPFTYVSIPQALKNNKIAFGFTEEESQQWTGEYQFYNTRIWDSARRLEPNMYQSGMVQCLSFGQGKPLALGRAGAILTDDKLLFRTVSQWRSDGRDLTISPWQQQQKFGMGFHYCPTLEVCALGASQLAKFKGAITEHKYPDLRDINFED